MGWSAGVEVGKAVVAATVGTGAVVGVETGTLQARTRKAKTETADIKANTFIVRSHAPSKLSRRLWVWAWILS